MANTYTKMRRTNQKIKVWLQKNDFRDVHLFPHTRFIKDVKFEGLDFDGLASCETKLVLFQCKSNCKPTKKTMALYKEVSERFGIRLLWLNNVDRKGVECYEG